MKVLQLGPYPPPHGGVQTNLVAIRNFLRDRRLPCAVINITRHRKPEADDVYYPKSSLALLRLLFHLDYDIIHLHLGGMLTRRLLGLCLACCSIPGKKAVLTFHSGGYPSSPGGQKAGARSLTAIALRRFDMLIGVNAAIVDFFHRLGVPSSRTRLIYPHSFSRDTDTAATIPEQISQFLSTHSPVFISVGLLEPEYDLPLQVEVLGQVRQSFPQAGLLMIGSGSLESELRQLIAAQRYSEAILLPGDVPHAATLQAISRSNLMLRTTLYDGDAVSAREALYLGIPVIATDNGMRPSNVHLVPTRDVGKLLETIQRVLSEATQDRPHPPQADETNIAAVFQVYRELMGER